MERNQTWLRRRQPTDWKFSKPGSGLIRWTMCCPRAAPSAPDGLLQQLSLHARREAGVNLPFTATTPYQNTIRIPQQPPFPGSQEMERRIKSLVRWNALAMVVRANKIAGRHRRTHLHFCLGRHAV